MTDWISSFGKLFWLPFVLWTGLFFWSRYLAYPLALKRRIRNGKTWCYVPDWWSKKTYHHFWTVFGLFVLVLSSVVSLAAVIFWILPATIYWFLFLVIVFLVVAKFFLAWAMNLVFKWEVNCYFYEYKKQANLYQKSGKILSEEDLTGHTVWAFQNDLRRADSRGRFFQYLKSMSQSEVDNENA
ncbi:MAG: hypothetical protein M0P13_06100 [Fibrobacteraceae bacterium]|nr:hypothetical protein [Fibrobacteraceae bacterium]